MGGECETGSPEMIIAMRSVEAGSRWVGCVASWDMIHIRRNALPVSLSPSHSAQFDSLDIPRFRFVPVIFVRVIYGDWCECELVAGFQVCTYASTFGLFYGSLSMTVPSHSPTSWQCSRDNAGRALVFSGEAPVRH
jgi:hypothetical protein